MYSIAFMSVSVYTARNAKKKRLVIFRFELNHHRVMHWVKRVSKSKMKTLKVWARLLKV